MLKIYQSYLIKKFLSKFFILTCIFFSLIIILGILEEISFFKNSNTSYFYPYFLTLLNSPITLFEIFPFILLLTTQFLLYDLFKNDELILLKINGLSNFKVIKILFFLSLLIGIFNVIIYYNFASKLKFHYSNIKNNHSNDNKYLAMVTENGIWIKDEINGKILITKSSSINGNFLNDVVINEFSDKFDLKRTIKSDRVDISETIWKISQPSITIDNNLQISKDEILFFTNFNSKKINSFFSNISTLDIKKLFNLIEDYKKIGYSTNEIQLHLLKLFSMPIFYGILTILSAIIMFNINTERPLIFHIVLGISSAVIIYYINFIFNSLASSDLIPIYLSIVFPMLILTIFIIIGLIDINDK